MRNSGTSSPVEPVRYLSVDEVVAMHERLLDRFGGTPGLSEPGLPDSALFRPQTGHYGDVVAMGAALLESLLINRPFDGGNTRTAFFAVDVFLRMNSLQIRADAQNAHRSLVDLMKEQTADLKHLEPWVRQYTVKMHR